MTILLALSVFTIVGSHVAVAGLLGHFWRPQTVFQGGDLAVIRSGTVPQSRPSGFEVYIAWEWAAFDPEALAERMPEGASIATQTLNLPARIQSVGETSVDERLAGTALFGRSYAEDFQPHIVSGRGLSPADEGHLVAVISRSHYLVAGRSGSTTAPDRAARVGLGDEVVLLVPAVRPGMGVPFVMGASASSGARYLCWDEARTVKLRIVGVFQEPGTLKSAILMPLGTLQRLTGAGSLVNMVGLRGGARLASRPDPSPLGDDFYVFSPAFTFAPLALQMEALRLQGRSLVATVALLTALVLLAIAISELAQRRRETSLLDALGLAPSQVALLAMARFAGVVLLGVLLALPPLVVTAYGLLGRTALRTLWAGLALVWPVLVLVAASALVSAALAPTRPLEGLTNE